MKEIVLIVTVGKSRDPVVVAHRDLNPMFTVFVASKKTSTQSGSEYVLHHDGEITSSVKGTYTPHGSQTAIITQLNLEPNQYKVALVEDPDNVTEVYKVIMDAYVAIQESHPHAEVVIEMTAGTKCMSAAATIVAYEESLRLSAVQGTRTDLVQVWGNSFRGNQSLRIAEHRRAIRIVQQRLQSRHYRDAKRRCEESLVDVDQTTSEVKQLKKLRDISAAFMHWDEFQHDQALTLLRRYGSEMSKLVTFLSNVEKNKNKFQNYYQGQPASEGHSIGIEIVADVYLNAIRRGEQGRYDDAIGRLYRALELQAQVLLLNYGNIRTNNVSLVDIESRVSPTVLQVLKKQGDQDKIKIALLDSYRLLADLIPAVKSVIADHMSELTGLLDIRNDSILAHGLTVITEEKYTKFLAFVTRFFRALDKALQRSRGIEDYPQLHTEVSLEV